MTHTQCPPFRAWTTRVSNPVCSPRFRASASVQHQRAAFATGLPPDIYAFHRYTGNSALPSLTQVKQYPRQFYGEAIGFHLRLTPPPTRPLSPVIPNNARHLCLTAAAGTELAVAYSSGTIIIFPEKRSLQPEDLHPPRGVAASGFPLLRNIPHCCLP